MSTKRERAKLAEDASKAHTDLNIFHAIIAILEGGTISSDAQRSAQFIIHHCKAGTAAALARYDRAIEKLEKAK